MKTYTQKELAEIIEKHGKWLRDEDGGERADLSESDLRGSDLSRSDLRGSDLSRSDLSGSELSGSDLRDSDLSGSDLRESDLFHCNLSHCNLHGIKNHLYIGQRSDGYQFFADHNGDDWVIRAGCQYMSIKDYRLHIQSYYCDKKRSETKLLLDYAELVIADRGIVENKL